MRARLAEWYERYGNKFIMWVAWKLPRHLVYWCAVRVNAAASTGAYGHEIVPEITMMDALDRWAGKKCEHGRLLKDYCQPCGRINSA